MGISLGNPTSLRGKAHRNCHLGWITALLTRGFPNGSVVKNLPARQETQETWVRSLGQEDPLEREMATCSNILAWKTPHTNRGAKWAIVPRVTKSWTWRSTHCLPAPSGSPPVHKTSPCPQSLWATFLCSIVFFFGGVGGAKIIHLGNTSKRERRTWRKRETMKQAEENF